MKALNTIYDAHNVGSPSTSAVVISRLAEFAPRSKVAAKMSMAMATSGSLQSEPDRYAILDTGYRFEFADMFRVTCYGCGDFG